MGNDLFEEFFFVWQAVSIWVAKVCKLQRLEIINLQKSKQAKALISQQPHFKNPQDVLTGSSAGIWVSAS